VPLSRCAADPAAFHRLLVEPTPAGAASHYRSLPAAGKRRDADAAGRSVSLERSQDRGKLMFSEEDVDAPTGTRAEAVHDLALYRHATDPHRGVLVVTTLFQFSFENGVSENPLSPGALLLWSPSEKEAYVREFIRICTLTWENRYELVDVSGKSAIRRISVEFDVLVFLEGLHTSEHWEVTVKKADGDSPTSFVQGGKHFASLDSGDFRWKDLMEGEIQFAAAHEFGHMLGLPDEYKAKSGIYAKKWLPDRASVMNGGSTVRPRHYAPFAHWVTRQFRKTSGLIPGAIEYKVNGDTDLSNAELDT
jgi:hypothetical protein